jgi:outer membrane protein assembly factor BamB
MCDGPNAPMILWKTSLTGEIDTPPLVITDTLFILKNDSYTPPRKSSVIKLDLFTGNIIDKVEAKLEDPYYDIFSDGTNFYAVSNNEIWEVDFNQKKLKSLTFIPEKRCDFRCHPIILETKIIFLSTPLICFSKPDFEVLWSTESIFSDHSKIKIINAAAHESHLLTIIEQNSQKKIYAFDIDTGIVVWDRPFPGELFSVSVENSIVYAGGEKIRAYDIDTGNILWSFVPEGKVFSDLIVGLEYLFATDSENQIYALDKNSGQEIWSTHWDGDPGWTFCAGGGKFLYYTKGLGEKSKIACFQTKDGTMMWEYTFDSPVHTHFVLAHGILVVALLKGEIYAFSTNPDIIEDAGITDESEVTSPPSKTEPPETAPPESTPPYTSPASTESSQIPPPGLEPSHIPEYLIVIAGIIGGILVLILYMWQKKK